MYMDIIMPASKVFGMVKGAGCIGFFSAILMMFDMMIKDLSTQPWPPSTWLCHQRCPTMAAEIPQHPLGFITLEPHQMKLLLWEGADFGKLS